MAICEPQTQLQPATEAPPAIPAAETPAQSVLDANRPYNFPRPGQNSGIYRLDPQYINSTAPLIYYDTEGWSNFSNNEIRVTYPDGIGGASSAVTSINSTYRYYYNTNTNNYNYDISIDSCTSVSYSLYATTDANGNIVYVNSSGYTFPMSNKDRLRERIRQNLSSGPFILKNRAGKPVSTEEQRARDLLRRIIGEKEYALFLRKGFLSARGKTGLVYRIPMGSGMIDCYHPTKQGKHKLFQRICVQFVDHSLPPTDALIMRKLLVENDEIELRKRANVFPVNSVSAEERRGVSDFLVGAA